VIEEDDHTDGENNDPHIDDVDDIDDDNDDDDDIHDSMTDEEDTDKKTIGIHYEIIFDEATQKFKYSAIEDYSEDIQDRLNDCDQDDEHEAKRNNSNTNSFTDIKRTPTPAKSADKWTKRLLKRGFSTHIDPSLQGPKLRKPVFNPPPHLQKS
jgi:hypothetical protein